MGKPPQSGAYDERAANPGNERPAEARGREGRRGARDAAPGRRHRRIRVRVRELGGRGEAVGRHLRQRLLHRQCYMHRDRLTEIARGLGISVSTLAMTA